MNAERLLKVYEQISEAPDAIARLRRFVLDLAVRGKLVEQDAADEPASELIGRLSAGKEQLVKAKVIKKPRVLGSDDELIRPYDIPVSWQWCRLDSVGAIVGGGTPSAGDSSNFETPGSGIAWLTPADLGGYAHLYISHGARDLSDKGLSSSSATLMPTRSVLFTSRAPIGYVAIAENPIATNQGFKSVVPFLSECSEYIALTLKALATEIDAKASGTTIKEVSGKIVAGIPFPLPPLAEQQRIVAKVDELMALCDRLEEARKTREEVRDKLTAASLARLTAPDTSAEDFPTHAAFALEALPALTTRPNQIKTLRQTILNLAVRGKLVEQDPADEPASELLAREFALPEGHQRRRKILKEAAVDASKGLLTTLPKSWEYARIQDLYDAKILIDYADGNHGSLYPRKSEFGDVGVNFVSAKDLVDGRVNWAGCSKLNQKRASQLTKGWAQTGDVLLTHNATVGRVARVPEKTDPFLLGTSVTFYRLNSQGISPDYFFLVLLSPFWQDQLEAIMAQTTRNQVSIQKQAFFTVPVPPLAEQHRIVAKVDALMALCDRLEAALTTTDTTRTRLLEALLHEALEPAANDLEAAQ